MIYCKNCGAEIKELEEIKDVLITLRNETEWGDVYLKVSEALKILKTIENINTEICQNEK